VTAALPPRPRFPHPPAVQRATRGRPLDELLAICLTAPQQLDRRVVARLVRELAPDGADPRLALALLAALVYARGGLLRASDGALLDRLESLWNETLTTDLAAPLAVAVRALAHTALGPALADRLLRPTTTPGTAVAPANGAMGAHGANGSPGAEGAAATPPLAGTLLDWLRFLVTRHPEWLDIDALIRRGAGACDRERVLGELVEPLLHHAPESFTPARLSALRGVFGTTQRWRYFAAFLAAEPSAPPESRRRAAAMLRGKLPYRRAATRLRRGGPFRLAVVQNLVFGQGDELIRLAPLLGPMLDSLPKLAITLLTPRPYLYDHPRVRALPIGEPAAAAAALDGDFEGLIEMWEPAVAELNLSPAVRQRTALLAARRPLRLEIAGRLGVNHFAFQRVALDGQEVGARAGLDLRTVRHVYDPVRRLLVELGLPLRGEHGPARSLLVGVPSPEADAAWRSLAPPGRPVALVSPFGGTREIKGYATDRLDLLAAELSQLVSEGYRVVVLPNGQPWVTPELVADLTGRVPAATRRHLAVAPDPACLPRAPSGAAAERPELRPADRVMRWFKYFAARADLVVSVEGWLAHLGWLLGRPLRVILAAQSYDEAWYPPARDREQRIVAGIALRSPRARRNADLLGSEDRPPLPGRDRKPMLIAALAELGATRRATAEPLLQRAARSADEDIRAAALCALGRLPLHEGIRRSLLAALSAPDPEVRGAGAEGLLAARLDCSRELGPRYREVLTAHVAIGARAWPTVVEIGGPAIPALVAAAAGRDDFMRREARWVLGELLQRQVRSPRPAGSR
jgi:ADP-heptose:LPS heptosyltransferase